MPPPRALSEEAELAEETDAFLTGRLVAYLAERRHSVPPWAVLNRVAHVTFRELLDLVAGSSGPQTHAAPGTPSRAVAERKLAFQLLTSGWNADGVHRAQMDVLIPLELALLELAELQGFSAADAMETAAEMLAGYSVSD